MEMSRTAAVILAGGRGERLGGSNKAMLEIGGSRLIDRVRRALAMCDPVLVAAGSVPVALDGALTVSDPEGDYAGPLAGVAAAVAALAGAAPGWLLSVAVDTPFFPADFLGRARALSDHVDVVVGCFGEQDYPTNALWRLETIATLPADVRNGVAPHSLRRLAAGLRSARLDYASVASEDPFANANTPEDLVNLRLRADRMARG
jgi:molybdopterin-guanine dinucleotide biosynthesis protein A